MKQEEKIFKTVVPGDMNLEKWKNGGYSQFIHGPGSCTEEVSKAITLFKNALLSHVNELVIIGNDYEVNQIESFITNYKP